MLSMLLQDSNFVMFESVSFPSSKNSFTFEIFSTAMNTSFETPSMESQLEFLFRNEISVLTSTYEFNSDVLSRRDVNEVLSSTDESCVVFRKLFFCSDVTIFS